MDFDHNSFLMENIYDKAIKEIIEASLIPLAEVVLHLRLEKTRELKDKIQMTLEREGDHFKLLVYEDTADNCILHLEFHVKDEDISQLMLLKKSMLIVRMGLPVRQSVIYMGERKKPKHLKPYYKDEHTEHRFDVLSLKAVDYRELLRYDIPEVVSIAILCDFGDKKPETVIREILQRLDKLTGGKKGASTHLIRLEIFSNLRNLQPLLIEISSKMAFTIDLKKDLRYKQGLEQGLEQGIQKGMQKGMQKGREKGVEEEKVFAIHNMLQKGLPAQTIAGIMDTTTRYVNRVKKWMEKETEVATLLNRKKLTDEEVASKTKTSEAFVAVVRRLLAGKNGK